jgi:hypothetical protein
MAIPKLTSTATLQALPDYASGNSLFADIAGAASGGCAYTLKSEILLTDDEAGELALLFLTTNTGASWFSQSTWRAQLKFDSVLFRFDAPPEFTRISQTLTKAAMSLSVKNNSKLATVSNGTWPDFACPDIGATVVDLPVVQKHASLLAHSINWRNGLGRAVHITGTAQFISDQLNEWHHFYEAVRTAAWMYPSWRNKLKFGFGGDGLKLRFAEPPQISISGVAVSIGFKLFGVAY